MNWNGSVAIITGGSKGIGLEIARAAAAKGAHVGLIARSAGDLEIAAKSLPGKTAFAAADVSDKVAVKEAIASIESELGPTDILVNNAGAGSYVAFLHAPEDEFEKMMQVNFYGTLYPTRSVFADMCNRGRGHIVNVSSIAGRMGTPFESAYSASKFAVCGLSEALAVEGSAFGVRVSMVNPGPVKTDFFATRGVEYARKFPRKVTPQRVAGAVIDAVEKNKAEQVIPRWLGFAYRFGTVVPSVYHSGAKRDSAKELEALRKEVGK